MHKVELMLAFTRFNSKHTIELNTTEEVMVRVVELLMLV